MAKRKQQKAAISRPRRDLPRAVAVNRQAYRSISSSELLAVSFLSLICLGTLGFRFLPGLYVGDPLGWQDSLFTATSAICITGLVVVDTGTYFTFWGQLYLLLLIQIGGLGILTLASVIITSLGAKPSINTEIVMEGRPATLSKFPIRHLVYDIFKFTLIFELLGGVALYVCWAPNLGWKEAVWPSIFHSVSAFCNAGFSTNSDSLMSHANSPMPIMIISLLVVCGGIGFITIEEIYRRYFDRRKKQIPRISIHSRIVLVGTALLLFAPPFAFAVFEWQASFSNMPVTDKIANSIFLAVTPRTAGFNTIDYGLASDSTILLTMILMAIGGSPGSLAGGMKITTFMLLGLMAWSKLKGHSMVVFGDRSIVDKSIKQAIGVFVIMTALMVTSIFMLQLVADPLGRDGKMLYRIFEVVSAINTVGLSMGITDQLPALGKLYLVFIMFIGRIGPLGLFAAFESRFSDRRDYRFASEEVIIG